MRAARRRLHRHLWISLLAICGLSVAPTVSRLLLTDADHCLTMVMEQPGRPVDSMAAMAAMDPAHRGSGPTAPMPAHEAPTVDRCDLCVVAALALFAAPEPAGVAGGFVATTRAVVLPAGSADRRTTWVPAAPRGPPALG